MAKFFIWVNNKAAGTIWAFDEFDARWRIAKRFGVPTELVSAQCVV